MHRPLRHVSIRVPWHDAGWTGAVCAAPAGNDACLALSRIRRDRVDPVEVDHRGQDWSDLAPEVLPPCVRERAGFMKPAEFSLPITHPYDGRSPAHDGLGRATLRIPEYAAPCIPFRRMRREYAEDIAEETGVDYRPELEQVANEQMPFESGWVQHGHNQRSLLDDFFAHLEKEVSLCFFYARRVPLTEDEGKPLIGVGRVMHVAGNVEFPAPGGNPLETIAWERMVQHSIRPGFENGFLLPYQETMEAAELDDQFDTSEFVAFVPDDAWDQFSYATEHVTHDAAISALTACETALHRIVEVLPGSRARELQWISDRLGELWRLRGPCPGLAAALEAFGVTHGTLVVRKLAHLVGQNDDPWVLVDKALTNPEAVLPGLEQDFTKSLREKWKVLDDERRSLLKLLSRFYLTPEQAERYYQPSAREAAGISVGDAELIANPYLLYELDRRQFDPITVLTVDHGAFPDEVIRLAHPLPPPSALDDGLEVRRVRALMIEQLEKAAGDGHTLQSARDVVAGVRKLPLDPPCPVDEDMLKVYGTGLAPAIVTDSFADAQPSFQLDHLRDVGALISRAVERRLGGARHEIDAPWRDMLDAALGGPIDPSEDPDEERARVEKTAALQKLAASRVSVLVGPAGTGKTTLLRTLCEERSVAAAGVLLLAPTGKARVKLGQSLKGLDHPAFTIAQFLLPSGRYVAETQTYRLSSAAAVDGYRTVIIDEGSMLTEEQLAAVIDGVKGVGRLILVGDPRQLPPIGAGRPLVDIVAKLEPANVESLFPRVAQGYAELTVPRRPTQTAAGVSFSAQRRGDLMLAEWFSGKGPSPGADQIWDAIRHGEVDETLKVVRWTDHHDLQETLLRLLVEELELESTEDVLGFECSIGGSAYNERAYFWRGRDGNPGAADRAEDWQILSPVKGHPHGVRELNRFIQRHFREATREWATSRSRRIPKPFGAEEVLWGDKVISLRNDPRRRVYPPMEDDEPYVANGDLGIVVGQWKTKAMKKAPRKLQVEFASQPGYAYEYGKRDFGEDARPPLELAYALTVHKAQGSEFERTFIVIPNRCRVLTRELVYTAVTRQKQHVTILYQGDPGELMAWAEPARSATAGRRTNLFHTPDPAKTVDGSFLERGLIHVTTAGDVVRSKSEALIAELLHAREIDYAYERKLTAGDGSFRYPDFTIEDEETGRIVYWEHLGMLHDSVYAERWEQKMKWYAAQGIFPPDAQHPQGGANGLLVWTRDDEHGGIDNQQIAKLIGELFE
jgi:hypothetical protein